MRIDAAELETLIQNGENDRKETDSIVSKDCFPNSERFMQTQTVFQGVRRILFHIIVTKACNLDPETDTANEVFVYNFSLMLQSINLHQIVERIIISIIVSTTQALPNLQRLKNNDLNFLIGNLEIVRH